MRKVIQGLRAPLKAVRSAAEQIKNLEDITLCHQPQLGIICFRSTPQNFPEAGLDDLQQHLYNRINAEQKYSLSLTKLNNQKVLRLVALTPETTSDRIMKTIKAVRTEAEKYKK
jgi:glutamate/tyrosine decarboxylase-like PLP-dependent enzyme